MAGNGASRMPYRIAQKRCLFCCAGFPNGNFLKGLSRMRGNSHVRFLGEKGAVMPLTYPIYPAGVNLIPVMAGLLTRPSRRAFPALHQWQVAATLRGLTAAGTVPDFHRVPFSFGRRKPPETISRLQNYLYYISIPNNS